MATKQVQIKFRPWALLYVAGIMAFSSLFQAVFVSNETAALTHVGVNYFSGTAFTSYQSDCPVLDGGYGGGNNPEAFIARIHQAYNYSGSSGCAGIQMVGAAYIVKTMLGGGAGQSKEVSAAEWSEWEARVRGVTMEQSTVNVYNQVNTSAPYRSGVKDVGQWYDSRDAVFATTVFKDRSGNVVYTFKNECGNPIGDNHALPPPYNYNLTPTISGSPTVTEGGQTITLNPTVNNAGPTGTPSTAWQITSMTVGSGAAVPVAATNTTAPSSYYIGRGGNVTNEKSGNTVFSKIGVNGPPGLPAQTVRIGDYPIGTRVCYVMSVSPYSHTVGNGWRHSAPFCVTIAKKPKIQILGNDLIVGKGTNSKVTTSTSRKTVGGQALTYGSWGEYGAVVSGAVSGMASGAGYSGGASDTAFCNVSLLTFSNAGSSVCSPSTPKGGYQTGKALPDIAAQLVPNSSLGIDPTINVATAEKKIYSATGNVSVTSSGQINPGRWVIINAPNSTVTIKNNIVYANGPFSNIKDIPQVVIIANNIHIDPTVTQVDAWLIASGATGNLVTCTEVTGANQLTADKCKQQLTINGPVVAKHLFLYRTAGAGTAAQTGAPAEVFNLRPDAYLWATAFSVDAGRLQTVSTKELPPRF